MIWMSEILNPVFYQALIELGSLKGLFSTGSLFSAITAVF
jgi:hypothetical protein